MGNEISMEDRLWDLKMTSKQLVRQSGALEKQERVDRRKVKMAIEKGSMENARTYAENAIRNKVQASNLLRTASRVDAVAQRVESAVRMQQVSRTMYDIVQGMNQALREMNLHQVSALMENFERTFEDLDVQAVTMEQAMQGQGNLSTPLDQVNALVAEIAEENGLELTEGMPPSIGVSTTELRDRLEKINSSH